MENTTINEFGEEIVQRKEPFIYYNSFAVEEFDYCIKCHINLQNIPLILETKYPELKDCLWCENCGRFYKVNEEEKE